MSPARLHRERLAAQAAKLDPRPIGSGEGGEQPASAPALPVMTPALEHRLTSAIAANDGHTGAALQRAIGVDPAVAQIMLRLTHDLRRLKEIQSIERKVEAKREMLPEYRPWCDLRLAAGAAAEGRELASSGADDVLPTIMVWSIDTSDWPRALELAEHVLHFDVPLPSRYQRAAAPLIAEEIATAAIKLQSKGQAFPLDVLEEVELLTGDADMHDEIRAKLMKAIGTELARVADGAESGSPDFVAAATKALAPLERAQDLHDRVGAKTTIQRLRKGIEAVAKAEAAKAATDAAAAATTSAAGDTPPATEQTGTPPVA